MENKKKINLTKQAIIFISITAILAIIGVGIAIMQLVSNNKMVESSNTEVKDKHQDIKVEETNYETTGGENNKSSNTKVESAAYIEKYIEQQVKGEMPEGADGKKVVYLTFDDGPSTTVTPIILDTLEREGVDATFFVLGKNVDTQNDLVRREANEGNVVAIHSYNHDYSYLYPDNKINVENCMADFKKTEESIKNVLGQDYKITALRFPGGYCSWYKNDTANAEALSNRMHGNNWYQVDWNCLSGDAEGDFAKNADQLYEEVVQSVGNREKAVLLMHDGYEKEATAEALPRVIQYLKQQGYEFKTIQ